MKKYLKIFVLFFILLVISLPNKSLAIVEDIWVNVGTAGFSVEQAYSISLAFNNNIPYVAYVDVANGYKATVMKYENDTWSAVGPVGFSVGNAHSISLAFNNNIPYVAYVDVANGYKATVMKYENDTWSAVGPVGFSAENTTYVSLAFNNNIPYVAYGKYGAKATVMKYENNTWSIVGTAGFSELIGSPILLKINFNDVLYLVYTQYSGKSAVMKYETEPNIFSYSGNFSELLNYEGLISGSRIMSIANDTFVNAGSTLIEGVHYTLTNKPAGLTHVMTIDALGEKATLTFTGNAVNHNDENDVNNLTITFLDGAFTYTSTASDVIGNTNNQGNINFFTTTFQGVSTLYASDGAGNNSGTNLYTLNPSTGEVIDIIGLTGYNINGMDFDPTSGILYGVTSNTDPDGNTSKSLFTIDPTTGIAELKGLINKGFADISFRSDGRLYTRSGWEEDNYYLYTIDKTCPDGNCTLTLVGEGQSDIGSGRGGGISFDSNDNLYLFDTEDTGFFKVDPDTALVLQSIPYTNISVDDQPITSAKFDGNDILFATRSNWGADTDLIMINVTTGEITSMGGKNPDIDYMTALAFYLDPEDTCSDGILNQDETGIDTGGVCTPAPAPQKRKSTGSSASVLATFQQEQATRAVDAGLTTQTTPSTPNTPNTNSPTLTRTLKYGMQGDDVKALQVYLNTHGYSVSLTGAGSLGNETTYFGLKTKQAVIKFQLANGLVGDGVVGPMTRAIIK